MTPNQVLYEISHQNLLLYGAAIPSYNSPEKKEREEFEWGGKMDFSNPDNFINSEERERV